jgi:hypothetical protein
MKGKEMFSRAQGEISINSSTRPIESIPDGIQTKNVEQTENGDYIISHSESGHHHLLERTPGVCVMERTSDVPAGMKIIYAILENPTRLYQDAGNPHDDHILDAGIHELRIAREYNPFLQEARKVSD